MGVRRMLLGLGSSIRNKEEIRNDWAWQCQTRGDTTKMKDFRMEVMDSVDFMAFAAMCQGSATIKVVHSLAKCPARGMPKEVHQVELGFMGDRRQRREPQPVEIPTRKGWEWCMEQVVKDGVEMKAAYARSENKGELWVPASSLPTEEAGVPFLLFLPKIAALFLIESPRSGEEFYDWLAVEAQQADPLWTEAEIKVAMDWAITSMQKRGNHSALALDLRSILTDEEVFDGWTSRRLDGTLGPEPVGQGAHLPPTGAAQGSSAGVDPLQMASAAGAGAALQVIRQMGPTQQGQTGKQGGQSRTTEKGRLYDEMDIAVLKGWAGVAKAKFLPKIYGRWETTKNWMHQRQMIYSRLQKWAKKRRWEAYLEKDLDIAETNIKDLVKLHPNPGSSVAIHQSAEQGCSILMCRPVTAAQVEERQRRSAARARAEGTRTEGDIYDELSEGPRAPARSYYELRENLITFTGIVYVLYGTKCDYYKCLLQLSKIILMERVVKHRNKFTAKLCKEITWRVIDEGRDFFSSRYGPEDFRDGPPEFKECMLHMIYDKVRGQETIYTCNFPKEWTPLNQGNTNQRLDLPPPSRGLPRPDSGTNPFGGGGTPAER